MSSVRATVLLLLGAASGTVVSKGACTKLSDRSTCESSALSSAPTLLQVLTIREKVALETDAGCDDSTNYKDPWFSTSCIGWKGYSCSGYSFSSALMQNCPAACGSCTASVSPVDTSSNYQSILDRHNKYRCMHGVPLMTWDDRIAQNAQQWARTTGTNFEHSSQEQRNIAGIGYVGENLAMGVTDAKAVDAFYNEIKYTSGGRVTQFSSQTGHYTQVVWKDSVKLGCGINGQLLVCQYASPGNYDGMFSYQVLPPSVPESQCR
mmetsp:Transcript_84403/g.229152  ORF Transcript_84403/g.229152 Transcript_84403/m.229152 type:complete len:264 (-) Transcript_84403:425-1216(-)